MNRTTPAALVLLASTLVACGTTAADEPTAPAAAQSFSTDDSNTDDSTTDDRAAEGGSAEDGGAPHGFVAGAAEVEEQQRTLLSVSRDGAVELVDLTTEEISNLGTVGPTTGIADDGRFVVTAGADGSTTVVDSGVWTTDHGDHVHYYRAAPTVVGEVDLTGTPAIVSTESRTVITAGGSAVLLDRERLGQGEIVEIADTAVDPDGAAIPLDAEHWAVTVDGVLQVRALDGSVGADAPCVDPQGSIVTRVGVVVGCADGALLVPASDGPAVIESIPYPSGTDTTTRATTFAGRTGRPTVAAVAPAVGFWLLDTRQRTWQLVPTSEVPVLVTAVDDRTEHVVGVLADGTVVVWDATGTELGRAAEPAGPVDDTLRLTVDADRAYVRSASTGRVLEIDYRDSARVARSLDVPAVQHLAEVGL